MSYKSCLCAKCGHAFITGAALKNIKCPECRGDKMVDVYEYQKQDYPVKIK